jgi:hypothetical protein
MIDVRHRELGNSLVKIILAAVGPRPAFRLVFLRSPCPGIEFIYALTFISSS